MRRKFQRVESDSVNDHRKDVEDHIESVTKHEQEDREDHKHKVSEERPCQLVYRGRDRRSRKSHRPKADIGDDVREHIDNAEQHRYDIDEAGENGFYHAALVIREDEA